MSAAFKPGTIFGRLTVLRFLSSGRARWECQCECGVVKVVEQRHLLNGDTASCGCKKNALAGALRRTHGQYQSAEYGVWEAMIRRCYGTNGPEWHNYGGRGISVCERWREDFTAFLADIGPRPSPRHSIERLDVNGNYEPSNCTWATATVQGRNRRNNRLVTVRGETMPLSAAIERFGGIYRTVHGRIARGQSAEVALGLDRE